MGTTIIALIVILICVYGVYSYVRKLRRGGSCCGEQEALEKKVRVEDKDRSHYPYTFVLTIDGMTCSNCVRRVENALNRLQGVWAQVDLGSRTATLYLKQLLPEETLRRAVRETGYTVLEVREQKEPAQSDQ